MDHEASNTVGRLLRPDVLGPLDSASAARLAGAGGDLAIVIDRDGIICDVAVSGPGIEGCETWVNRRWTDTVTKESQAKIGEMLRDAADPRAIRWREINHTTHGGQEVAMRYVAVEAGQEGRIVAIGRDHRPAAVLQQRLLQAQQAMERDYARMRESEARYRLLFQMMGEGVVIVDAGSRRVADSNPAAERLLGADGSLIGKPFSRLFAAHQNEDAVALLSAAQSSPTGTAPAVRLAGAGRAVSASATLFREGRTMLFLVRMTAADAEAGPPEPAGRDLVEALERIPDSLVVTDEAMTILDQNVAFLDLARLPGPEQARGQSLARFLGRPGLDRNILLETLQKHGIARNLPTILRTELGELEDVEVSAVALSGGAGAAFAFSIRPVPRRATDATAPDAPLSRTNADLEELVGKVPLKDIVRDTTDYVERLCIIAALNMTGNNRASAAEILGLSRQSLYSKLNRFGLTAGEGPPAAD
jgi:transcriptional regulator PpsR